MPKPLTEVIVKLPDQTQHRHLLEPGEYLVGRHPNCPIRVDSPDVSQQHARLLIGVDDLRLEDLGSSNGSFIQGERLTGSIRLRPPQRIQLGSAVLEIKHLDETAAPTPATPSAHSSEESIRKPRNYRIGGVLAQGGMGAILDAQDLNIERSVAMKVMRSGKQASQESRLRFIQEAKVLGRLEHPNIVPIHELGIDADGQIFYTMKLVKGVTLHQVLTRIKGGELEATTRYPLSQLLTVFQKVCDAISFAHSQGVIHRDLKPENVMLGDFGEVLVMDWGLAKIVGHKPPAETAIEGFREGELPAADGGFHTLEGKIMGTPNFMAPEQAEGRIGDIDARTDVFALGGILYNILTLVPPVNGATTGEILEKIKRGAIAPPTTFNQTTNQRKRGSEADGKRALLLPHCPGRRIPEALSAVAMKALATDPANRYQSVEELQQDIGAYQGGFATGAERAGTWRQITLLVKRHKTVTTAAALILALVSGFVLKLMATLAELRQSAPAFYTEARASIEEKNFTNALAKIGTAITLRPDDADYYALQGNIYESLFHFQEAAAAYTKALQRNPQLSPAVENLALSKKLQAAKWALPQQKAASLEELWQAMIRQGRSAEAQALAPQIDRGKVEKEYLARWRAELDKAGIKGELKLTADGWLELDLSNSSIQDLTPLRELPLTSLNLAGTAVTDLKPLQGMLLSALYLTSDRVSDLTPLVGMPLHRLGLENTTVTNMAPLRGMPLTELSLSGTAVTDLRPLKGMPLTFLQLTHTRVADLTPLKGMPLTVLQLQDLVQIADLTPLEGMPLVNLNLNGTRITDLTALKGMRLTSLDLKVTDVHDLSPLRGMPLTGLDLQRTKVTDLSPLIGLRLSRLQITETTITNFSPIKDLPLTQLIAWSSKFDDAGMALLAGKQLDTLAVDRTDVTDLSVLRGMPLRSLGVAGTRITDISVVRDMPLDSASLGYTKISDFSPLKGKPVRVLDLAYTSFSDTSLLRGMPLEFLNLDSCAVSDLRPIEGSPVQDLNLNATRVSDLRPLKGMPLRVFRAGGTKVTDVSALDGMPLVWLDLGKTAVTDLRPLRNSPLTTYLNLSETAVADLTVLRGKLLTTLRLDGCAKLQDFSPIADCATLQSLSIPTTATNIEVLRRLPTLQHLAYAVPYDNFNGLSTTAEFWKTYDADRKKHAARPATSN